MYWFVLSVSPCCTTSPLPSTSRLTGHPTDPHQHQPLCRCHPSVHPTPTPWATRNLSLASKKSPVHQSVARSHRLQGNSLLCFLSPSTLPISKCFSPLIIILCYGWAGRSSVTLLRPCRGTAWPREQEGNTQQEWLLVLHWVLESLGSEMSVPAVGPSGSNKINLVWRSLRLKLRHPLRSLVSVKKSWQAHGW